MYCEIYLVALDSLFTIIQNIPDTTIDGILDNNLPGSTYTWHHPNRITERTTVCYLLATQRANICVGTLLSGCIDFTGGQSLPGCVCGCGWPVPAI